MIVEEESDGPLSNEEVVHAYAAAHAAGDIDRLSELRHPGWVADWPQSGERVRGDAAARALDAAYPGGRPTTEAERIVGSEDRWVVTPVFTPQRVVGSGDFWWADGKVRYPDGSIWFSAMMVELREGKIFRETVYFAEPFEAPAWRAPFVERMDQGR